MSLQKSWLDFPANSAALDILYDLEVATVEGCRRWANFTPLDPRRSKGQAMGYEVKRISATGIAEAIAKAELYRSLSEPEEAESICRDILAIEPQHQLALRLLGLTLTDQFTGHSSDRYNEAKDIFLHLNDPYERLYYTGLLYERRAKAMLKAGQPPRTLLGLFDQALRCFTEAEKIRPAGNDDAILRWNRCVRVLQNADYEWDGLEVELVPFDAQETPPR